MSNILYIGTGAGITGVLAYFNENFLDNSLDKEISFYRWTNNNGYLSNEEMIEKKADIFIISSCERSNNLEEDLIKDGYEVVNFYGYVFIKDAVYLSDGFIVYIKPL